MATSLLLPRPATSATATPLCLYYCPLSLNLKASFRDKNGTRVHSLLGHPFMMPCGARLAHGSAYPKSTLWTGASCGCRCDSDSEEGNNQVVSLTILNPQRNNNMNWTYFRRHTAMPREKVSDWLRHHAREVRDQWSESGEAADVEIASRPKSR